jgi:predicted acylesterase/phospholipase RssA
MMSIIKPEDVRHLVFGGGGGRGWAHIGAIQYLETRIGKPLVTLDDRASGRIEGVAGASIGAFVAMCVALGATASQIRDFASVRLNAAGHRPGEADTPILLEDISWPANILGVQTVVNGKFEPDSRNETQPHMLTDEYLRDSLVEVLGIERSPAFLTWLNWDLRGSRPSTLMDQLRQAIDGRLDTSEFLRQFRVFTRNEENFKKYFVNLQLGGLIPGYLLKDFITRAVKRFANTSGMTTGSDGTLTFRELYDQQSVELAVTGTQLASRRGYLFSYRDTPDFEIVPAVCISMAFPLIFKPVSVSSTPRSRRVMPDHYTGRWSDGGMINNLPLRAFPRRGSLALDPRTVAFALTEPANRESGTTVKSNFDRIYRELSGVYLDQPVNSQLALETDVAQVVSLKTPELNTFDLTWSEKKVSAAIDAAEQTTREYFQPSQVPGIFAVVKQWATSGKTDKDAVDPQLFEAIVRAQFRSYFKVVTPAPVYVIPFIDEDKTRSDALCSVDLIVGCSPDVRTWFLVEAKSSPTARLSRPQRDLFPFIGKFGGLLVNARKDDDEEWAPFVDRTELPAQEVIVVMPYNLSECYKKQVEQVEMQSIFPD